MIRIAILLLLWMLAGCNTIRLVSPPPSSVPQSMTEEEIEYVLISCLGSSANDQNVSAGMHMANEILHRRFGGEFVQKRYWSYEGRDKDVVYAGFNNRSHYMRVKMAYSKEDVRFSIVDSRNLKQTKTRIHRNAMQWLGGLESGIRSCLWEVDRLRYERELFDTSTAL